MAGATSPNRGTTPTNVVVRKAPDVRFTVKVMRIAKARSPPRRASVTVVKGGWVRTVSRNSFRKSWPVPASGDAVFNT